MILYPGYAVKMDPVDHVLVMIKNVMSRRRLAQHPNEGAGGIW